MAYLAPSLVALRDEVDVKWPNRDKASDGWIGDASHSARVSQHNPDAKGCVHAIDVDKDGIDPRALIKELIGDPRVWYVIFNGVIWSRTYGWSARAYTGPNKHEHHIHVSIQLTTPAETDTRRWFDAPSPAKDTSASVVPPWTKEQDHPSPKPRPVRPTVHVANVQRGKKNSDVLVVQKALAAYVGLDYSSGPGLFGPRTEAAYDQARRKMGYRGADATGAVGKESLSRLGQKYGFSVV